MGDMDDPPYLSGKLLLAMPGIGDPRFERAVIAICAMTNMARSASDRHQAMPGSGCAA